MTSRLLAAPPAVPPSQGRVLTPCRTTHVARTVQVMTPQAYVDRAGRFLTTTNAGRGMVAGVVILIGASLGVAVSRVLERVNSSRNLRLRQLDKNKAVVTELSNFLPNNRDRLSGGAITVRLWGAFACARTCFAW